MELFVNARFLTQPITGVQRYGIEISRQIKRLEPKTVFLTPGGIVHNEVAKELNARVVGRLRGHAWEQIELPGYIEKRAPLFNPGNTAPLLHARNYITIHDLAFRFHPEWNSRSFAGFYNWLIPRIARRARHLFTVSDTVKEELQSQLSVPSGKVSVTYNGISEDWRSLAVAKPKEKIILAVGSFSPRKNHPLLIRAFLETNLPEEYKLYIIGRKQDVFADSGLAGDELSRIEILEEPDDEILRNLYQRAEIAVSLSAYEGFGLPVLEGLYFGCKVLCSDIPVYRQLYSNYVYFCNIQNIREISDSLLHVTHVMEPNQSNAPELFTRFNYPESAKIILERIRTQEALT